MIANPGYTIYTYIWTFDDMITMYGMAEDGPPIYLKFVGDED